MMRENTTFNTENQNSKAVMMIDAFIDFIDGIYWHGYADELQEINPEKYSFELTQFITNY